MNSIQKKIHTACNRLLLYALKRRSPRIMRLALRMGANPDITDNKGVPLLCLCCRDYLYDEAYALIDHGADIDIEDPFYLTPLMYSAIGGHHSMALLCLNRQADVCAHNVDEDTALDLALRHHPRQWQLIALLQRHMPVRKEPSPALEDELPEVFRNS